MKIVLDSSLRRSFTASFASKLGARVKGNRIQIFLERFREIDTQCSGFDYKRRNGANGCGS